jgi:2-pyrone-4,6-dicarboxylate lactonase
MMQETTAAPAVSRPAKPPPRGAADVHSHVFGPFDRFPPVEKSLYALPDAPPEAHAAMRAALGMTYGVLTQPAPYGEDPSAMITAIAASDGALRGVGVAGPGISDHTLARWREQGIVGLRFVEMRTPQGARYPGSLGFDVLDKLAPRMRELGFHAQLWVRAESCVEELPMLERLGIPIVLDHFGSPDLEQGPRQRAFSKIVERLDDLDIWVKLTLCRFFAAAPGFEAVRPFHDRLLAEAPHRLLWGSDWPYVRLDPAPDAGRMLDIFGEWTSDEALRKTILVDNPRKLYGFERPSGEM